MSSKGKEYFRYYVTTASVINRLGIGRPATTATIMASPMEMPHGVQRGDTFVAWFAGKGWNQWHEGTVDSVHARRRLPIYATFMDKDGNPQQSQSILPLNEYGATDGKT